MLNRLFIVVGLIAIAAIVAGFVAPYFIDWSQYRGRLEAIASQTLGTDARVNGEIQVSLLPQPHLRLENVEIGTPEKPLAKIGSVEANLSLLDFLRDRYAVTRLVLVEPMLFVEIGTDGKFFAPVHLPQTDEASNVSIADAEIVGGVVRFSDARLGKSWDVTDFSGGLQMAGLRGPFALQGNTRFGDRDFDARINTSTLNAAGGMQATAFLRPTDNSFSLALEGLVQTKDALRFTGDMVFRQAAGKAAQVKDARGDLVLTTKVDATSNQILFSDYLMVPDENRAVTRMTGAAVVQLGAEPSFDAVLSGGVLALTPRDAREETSGQPYELLRLLDELPAPLVPPISGRIGLDISELGLRAVSMRDVRLDAETDGVGWTVSALTGRLPGNTKFSFVGRVDDAAGRPSVEGAMTLDSERLDMLAQLWRKTTAENPLFNMPGTLSGRVSMGADGLSLSDGEINLDGVNGDLTLAFGAGPNRSLDVFARLGALDTARSEALSAFLPDMSAASGFTASFVGGTFDLAAERMFVEGLDGAKLAARGRWSEAALVFDQLGADNLGGMRFAVKGKYHATPKGPKISGSGNLSLIAGESDAATTKLLALAGLPKQIGSAVNALRPAEVRFDMPETDEAGAQQLNVNGRIGAATGDAMVRLDGGLTQLATAPLTATIKLRAADVEALAAQFGLPPISPVSDSDGVVLDIALNGTLSNSIDVKSTLAGGDDELAFNGSAIVADIDRIRGKGTLNFALSDIAPVAEMLGAGGVGHGGARGTGELSFHGFDLLSLTNIDADAGGMFVTGDISRNRQGANTAFSGDLRASTIDIGGLAGLLGGASALIESGGMWPDGPMSTGNALRPTRGRIAVSTPFLRHDDRDVAEDLRFNFVWDESNLRLRAMEMALGGGALTLDITACCTGVGIEQQINGRAALTDIDMNALFPLAIGRVLDGRVDGGVQFTGAGGSYADILAGLNGEGSFTVKDFTLRDLDPGAFDHVAELKNILELSPEALTAEVETALKRGAFTADEFAGVFSLAGGALRVSNLAAEGGTARLFGDAVVSLSDLALSGAFVLTPTGGGDRLADASAQATALLSGTLLAPIFKLDLGPMIDAIKVRAYEIEVDRLEKLRAEEEARAAAAAARRADLMAQEARRMAEEQAKQAAEDAARKQRSEEDRLALDALLEALEDSRDPLLAPQPNQQNAPVDLLSPEPAPAEN